MARKQKDSCAIAGCNRTAGTRGLCSGHYGTADDAIARGDTTWAELESFGMAKPPGRPGRKSKLTAQLHAERAKQKQS